MYGKISVVSNTYNEERDIQRALKSVKWVDEVIVCDMHSTDKTVQIAREFGARVIYHKQEEYVELVRNFAISKATSDWILILDPDEEVSQSLADRLMEIAKKMKHIDYIRLPRKNIIFGKWMQTSMWWPDYNIRFFKKGKVKWGDKIHRPPQTEGVGLDLPAEEKWAIIHHHYESISQFLERMGRYTKIQSDELKKEGYVFDWKDLIRKPLGEFLGRFFANRGFEDGVHGLSLSLLQAFSHLLVYLRLWEMGKFKESDINNSELEHLAQQSGEEIKYWFKNANIHKDLFKKFLQKIRNKI